MFELIPFDRHLSRVSAFDPFRDFEELERRFFGNTGNGINAFRTDVIELKPEYVVILAGINDIARNTGYIGVEHTFGNLVSMVELAQANGIKPVLCTVLPASAINWRRELGDPRPLIAQLNELICQYAASHNLPLVDYHAAMKDADNGMDQAYVTDPVHPNLAGYKVMEKVLMDVLNKN